MTNFESKKKRSSVPVSDFLEAGLDTIGLELIAGENGLRRTILEAAINRPGLALSGFFEYFAHRRIQVMGAAEYAYLNSLQAKERAHRLEDFFKRKIPCVVIARNKRVFPEIPELAKQYRVPVLRTRRITKHVINASTIIMENLMAPRMKVQGTMVEIVGIGVLIVGKSGMGKSDTALGLIKKGHALVSDDITALRTDSAGRVLASAVEVTRYHMEIRGVGIIHVPSLFGVASVRGEKRLDLVATLCRPGEKDNLPFGRRRSCKVLTAEVPEVVIEVTPGRDLANVIESAALDQKLRNLGHDAEKELDTRLVNALSGS